MSYKKNIEKYKKYLDIFINNIKENNNNLTIKYFEIEKFYPLHGSILNYFHFMTSVFIPIVLAQNYFIKMNISPVFILNDNFGPMLRILNELPIDIKLKCQNPKYFKRLEKKNIIIKKLFRSYDIHPSKEIKKRDMELIKKGYSGIITSNIRDIINKWMGYNIEKYNMYIVNKYDILIIERKVNKSYKTIITNKDEKDELKEETKFNKLMKYTGSELRSIINHKEFVDFIKKYYYNKSVINVSLDYMPIFDQYQLFNNAKLVFAQHGASLFNIMFMKKDSKLVEIIDKNKNNIEDWFSFYSTLSNIKHYKYITDEAHTKIDINIFRKYLTDNKI